MKIRMVIEAEYNHPDIPNEALAVSVAQHFRAYGLTDVLIKFYGLTEDGAAPDSTEGR